MSRVKLLFDCPGPNPAFDSRRPAATDNPAGVIVPAGTVLEHPDAWQHCLPDAAGLVRAEPADEATAQKVQQAEQRRQARLNRLSPRQQKAREKLQAKLAHLGPDSVESGESRAESGEQQVAAEDPAGEASAAAIADDDEPAGEAKRPRKAATRPRHKLPSE